MRAAAAAGSRHREIRNLDAGFRTGSATEQAFLLHAPGRFKSSGAAETFTAAPQCQHLYPSISENPVNWFSFPQCGHISKHMSNVNSISRSVRSRPARRGFHHGAAFVADDVRQIRLIASNHPPKRSAAIGGAEVGVGKDWTFWNAHGFHCRPDVEAINTNLI
jgi:hypothetical protein